MSDDTAAAPPKRRRTPRAPSAEPGSAARIGPASRMPEGGVPPAPEPADAVTPATAATPTGTVVTIHTDGACSGNPGPGGWGAILAAGAHQKELFGGEPMTTNNRMEMTAAIKSLEALKRPSVVDLHTDSQYVRQGITAWIFNWQKRGWKTADGKPVKNDDLWRRLAELTKLHTVRWHWVKGHAGHAENERADALARQGVAAAREAGKTVG